ncbi:MAG: thiamine biosynthesis lipoprotein [Cellvibrionaceae bacterium]|jgi:thiamine biosynthesis lipoprotein
MFAYKKKRIENFTLTPIFKASFLFVASVLIVVLVSGCDGSEKSLDAIYINGPTMGTSYNITVVSPLGNLDQEQLKRDITLLLKSLNQQMSTYIDDSDIIRFNQKPIGEPHIIKDDFLDVLQLSQRIAKLTEGRFDITIGPLVELWGFGSSKRLQEQLIPSDEDIIKAKSRVGWQYLLINQDDKTIKKASDIWLDVSAVAKGYGVDKIAELLEANQIKNFLVEIGGEMRVKGLNRQQQLWRIGIETPSLLQKRVQQLVQFSNKAIATSGDYRNYFEENGKRFSHAINPTTGRPIRHNIASVSVIAETAAEADALATALTVLGEKAAIELAEREQMAVYFIFHDDTQKSDGAGYRIVYTDPFKKFIQ